MSGRVKLVSPTDYPPARDRRWGNAFTQRVATLIEILEADGEVLRVDDTVGRSTRKLRIELASPGYDLPVQATFEYKEWYRRATSGWSLTDYQYEVRLHPTGSARKAFHWHEDSHHVHCADPRSARSNDHYRGYEVDLLKDARPDLLRIVAAGVVDCSGLHIVA